MIGCTSTDSSEVDDSKPKTDNPIMKITIIGAGGGEVTGSAYYVLTCLARVLIDCSLMAKMARGQHWQSSSGKSTSCRQPFQR